VQLLVGSEDFEIRIYHEVEVIHEATENDVITGQDSNALRPASCLR
jgi:hypothetical protein